MNPGASASTRSGKHVVAIGLGNIGSPMVEMLARSEMVDRLTLIDSDLYETNNLSGQAILPSDVGKPKALVQAERARTIRPSLVVEGICAAVEDVPLGQLRGDAVLTGLDSKLSRQQVNERVWRLGVPWVDGGVDAAGWLARISTYAPGPDQPCLECAWDERDYRTLEVRRPCQMGTAAAPTGAPAFLGALAAAFLMAEVTKLLSHGCDPGVAGTQLTVALAAHKLIEMKFRRNPRCRFDHEVCGEIRPLPWSPNQSSLGQLICGVQQACAFTGPMIMRVPARRFERQLRCACGEQRPVLCLQDRIPDSERLCARCGTRMSPVGYSRSSWLSEEELTSEHRDQLLAAIGFRSGEIITVKSGAATRAFELVDSQNPEAA